MTNRVIAWAKGLYEGIEDWLRVCFNRSYHTTVVEENLPERLRQRALYVVQEDGFLEQVAMLCPCGCGRTLHMNLIPDERPCWQLVRHPDGTATLHPSVWRKKDCGSHFWFRRGRVQWCRSDEH